MKLNMEALNIIKKTREYLDYLEEHIENVEKSFQYVKEKCSDLEVFKNVELYNLLYNEVTSHDISKLSCEEFIQYRLSFYPIDNEDKKITKVKFDNAQYNHKINNRHHWENQTKSFIETDKEQKIHCTHMIIDQYAMSLKFGDTPKEYYIKNKNNINIPKYAINYLNKLLNRLE